MPWTVIADSRIAAGKLWLPELSLNMLANDWVGVYTHVRAFPPSGEVFATTTDWQTIGTIEFEFPPQINPDDTYDTTLQMNLGFPGTLTTNHTTGAQARVYISADTKASGLISITDIASPSSKNGDMTLAWTNTETWPTGWKSLAFQVAMNSTANPTDSATLSPGVGTGVLSISGT